MKPHDFLKAGLTAAVVATLSIGMTGCGGGTTKQTAPAITETTASSDAGALCATTAASAQSPPSTDVPEIETVVMPDGKTWMKRNLNVETDDSWCYADDPSNCEKYGRLYTWQAAIKACAGLGDGWRLPSDKEWDNLVEASGEDVAGTKLKSKTGWNNNDDEEHLISGTDDFGFSAMPGGGRDTGGRFYHTGYNGNWWTATEYDGSDAWRRSILYCDENVSRNDDDENSGFSVRCLRD